MNDKKSVYIAILNQGDIRTELVSWMMYVDRNAQYKIMFDMPSEKPIANNRNQIVERFLKSGFDYLLQIDDDIVPPYDFLDLVDEDVDIITPLMFAHRVLEGGKIGLVPLILERTNNPTELTEEDEYLQKSLGLACPIDDEDKVNYNVIGSARGEDYGGRGLVECDATGTGAMIVKREVLEDIKAPFLDVFDDETGKRTLGLDINFCHRAKKKGYRVFVHTDYIASHWTDMDQKMVYESLSKHGIGITGVGK